jgi:hypothetical protein
MQFHGLRLRSNSHLSIHTALFVTLAALTIVAACDSKTSPQQSDGTEFRAEIEEAEAAANEQLLAGQACLDDYESCSADADECMTAMESCVQASADETDDETNRVKEKNPHWKQGQWKKHGWLKEAMAACLPEHKSCANKHAQAKPKGENGSKHKGRANFSDLEDSGEDESTSVEVTIEDTSWETGVATTGDDDDNGGSVEIDPEDADDKQGTAEDGDEDQADDSSENDESDDDGHGKNACKSELRSCVHDAMNVAFQALCLEIVARCDASIDPRFGQTCENIRRKCDEATTLPDDGAGETSVPDSDAEPTSSSMSN